MTELCVIGTAGTTAGSFDCQSAKTVFSPEVSQVSGGACCLDAAVFSGFSPAAQLPAQNLLHAHVGSQLKLDTKFVGDSRKMFCFVNRLPMINTEIRKECGKKTGMKKGTNSFVSRQIWNCSPSSSRRFGEMEGGF